MPMPTTSRRFASVLAIPALLLVAACTSSTGGATASVPAKPSTAASQPAPSSAAPTAAPSKSASTGGGKGGDYGDGEYGATPTPAAASSDPGGGDVTVAVATTAAGSSLVGADGLTLYIFTKDSANTSACGDGCVGTWPPFTVAAGTTPAAGPGVTGSLTTFARADGSQQVAYDGNPLYYFTGDQAPGDANGEGIGEVWFIATP